MKTTTLLTLVCAVLICTACSGGGGGGVVATANAATPSILNAGVNKTIKLNGSSGISYYLSGAIDISGSVVSFTTDSSQGSKQVCLVNIPVMIEEY